MKPAVSFISLGVRDTAASRAFYVEGLGWPVHMEVPGEVIFVQVNHGLMLSLWDRAAMAADAGVDPSGGIPAITLSQNLGSPAEVDEALAQAVAAGAVVAAEGKATTWGGYVAYFADPDGFRWELAFNPTWQVDDGGDVTV
ncbi:VOC family protein [Arthrobacter sp. 35W]|uniref:VOC family protein n=1 Tax=Arthrobacter sp. 35W TaxID=1132441 RepID=UPI000409DC0B|nr:VOC family protein [Arthrobacter sp. 35W]